MDEDILNAWKVASRLNSRQLSKFASMLSVYSTETKED